MPNKTPSGSKAKPKTAKASPSTEAVNKHEPWFIYVQEVVTSFEFEALPMGCVTHGYHLVKVGRSQDVDKRRGGLVAAFKDVGMTFEKNGLLFSMKATLQLTDLLSKFEAALVEAELRGLLGVQVTRLFNFLGLMSLTDDGALKGPSGYTEFVVIASETKDALAKCEKKNIEQRNISLVKSELGKQMRRSTVCVCHHVKAGPEATEQKEEKSVSQQVRAFHRNKHTKDLKKDNKKEFEVQRDLLKKQLDLRNEEWIKAGASTLLTCYTFSKDAEVSDN